MKLHSCVIIVLLVITTGCATSDKSADSFTGNPANGQGGLIGSGGAAEESFTDEEFDLLEEELDDQEIKVDDPLEGINRLMFGFNDVLYYWILKPCIETCKAVVPEPGRIGIRNFFRNVS
ncbi:MAG: MlaA family lipoprotein, partial [Planctomycetota bacterium]